MDIKEIIALREKEIDELNDRIGEIIREIKSLDNEKSNAVLRIGECRSTIKTMYCRLGKSRS